MTQVFGAEPIGEAAGVAALVVSWAGVQDVRRYGEAVPTADFMRRLVTWWHFLLRLNTYSKLACCKMYRMNLLILGY